MCGWLSLEKLKQKLKQIKALKMIKVLMIGPLTQGGRERRMAQLIVGLDKYPQYEVSLLVPDDNNDYDEILSTHASITYMDSAMRSNLYASLQAIIQSFTPDILHLWFPEIHWFFAIHRLRRKYGFKYIAGYVSSGVKVTRFSALYFANLVGYYKADAVVSNSKAGLKARRAPKKRSYVIPNGFSFLRFEKKPSRRLKRNELNLGNSLAIAMIARFDEGKDWDLFLDLAQRAYSRGFNAVFLAIGSGPLQGKYKQRITEMGLKNILFLGRRNDVEEILMAIDISVLFDTSKHAEGISNSLMEAMAAGLPVIATGTGGTPELVSHEETGFLVDEYDVEGAFMYLSRLYDDAKLRERIGNNARDYIRNYMSLDNMTKSYMELYQRLLNICSNESQVTD